MEIKYLKPGQYPLPTPGDATFFQDLILPELVLSVLGQEKGFVQDGRPQGEEIQIWEKRLKDQKFAAALYEFFNAQPSLSRNILISDARLTFALYELYELKQIDWANSALQMEDVGLYDLPALAKIAANATAREAFLKQTDKNFSIDYATTHPESYVILVNRPACDLIAELREAGLIPVNEDGFIDDEVWLTREEDAGLFEQVAKKPEAVAFLKELLALEIPFYKSKMDEIFHYRALNGVLILSEPSANKKYDLTNQAKRFLLLDGVTSDHVLGGVCGNEYFPSEFVELCKNPTLRDYAYELIILGGSERSIFNSYSAWSNSGRPDDHPCHEGLAKICANPVAKSLFTEIVTRKLGWTIDITGNKEVNAQFLKLAKDPKCFERIGAAKPDTPDLYSIIKGKDLAPAIPPLSPPEEILKASGVQRPKAPVPVKAA